TGEALAAILRPGNATTNSIADQLAAVDAALAQLPGEIGIGHRPGDEASLVRRAVRVRADSAGCSPKLATALRDRNAGCRGGPHQRPGPSSDLPGHRRPSSVGTGAHPRWRGAPRRRGGRADRAHQPRRLAAAEPKTLRWELWRTPARVVRRSRRRILRVLDTWPTTWHLLGAYQRLALIT
ncbi:MAG: hypothetical protein KY458_00330, partial [Actinobacteria bacterium]|nr:hypothetical protein [Actinomycetota bacterium]